MVYEPIVGVPRIRVEIAPTAGKLTVSPTYVDVTDSVRLDAGITCSRGRNDRRDAAQVGRASLTFKNPNGDFTPGNVNGAFHPLRLNIPIRIWLAPGVSVGGGGLYNDGDLYDDDEVYDDEGDGGTDLQLLWSGYITSYTVDVTNAGSVQVQANDRLAVFEQVKLRHWETHEHLATSPAVLIPLTEEANASAVGDVASGSTFTFTPTQVGTGGSVDTGVGALPIDDGTVVGFSPADINNGWAYQGSAPNFIPSATVSTAADSAFAVSVLMNTFETPTGNACMWSAGSVDGYWLEALVTSAGKLRAQLRSGSTVLAQTDSVATITSGEWFQAGATLTRAGDGTWQVRAYVNGAQSGTTAAASGTSATPLPQIGSTFTVGGRAAAMFSGQLSHAAFWVHPVSPADCMTRANGSLTGAPNEVSTDRFLRVCRYAGITGEVGGVGLSTLGRQKLSGRSVLDVLDEIAAAELSAVDISGAGVPRLRARDARYNAPVALALTALDAGAGTSFELDDSTVVNDVSAARPGGPTIREVNAASVEQHGPRTPSGTGEFVVADDVQLASIVQWMANVNAEATTPRVDELEVAAWVKQATLDLQAVFDVSIDSRISVTNLPAAAPVSTLDLFVEGVTDTINLNGWTRKFNTSSVERSGAVWQLDSDVYSVLDSTTTLGV